MSDKYICFKTDEWDDFVSALIVLRNTSGENVGESVLTEMPEPVADAEVFRHQDLVSAPIFYNASSIYQSYIELVGETLTEDQRAYLKEVADHFYEAGDRATGLPNRKLPD